MIILWCEPSCFVSAFDHSLPYFCFVIFCVTVGHDCVENMVFKERILTNYAVLCITLEEIHAETRNISFPTVFLLCDTMCGIYLCYLREWSLGCIFLYRMILINVNLQLWPRPFWVHNLSFYFTMRQLAMR